MFLPEFNEDGGLSSEGGTHFFIKSCDTQSKCGDLEICYSQSYCAAFCSDEAGHCPDGYKCHLGLCLIEHPEMISNKDQVFPCMGNLECPLDMVCNKVCDIFLNLINIQNLNYIFLS